MVTPIVTSLIIYFPSLLDLSPRDPLARPPWLGKISLHSGSIWTIWSSILLKLGQSPLMYRNCSQNFPCISTVFSWISYLVKEPYCSKLQLLHSHTTTCHIIKLCYRSCPIEVRDCLLPNLPIFRERVPWIADWIDGARLEPSFVGINEQQECVWAVTHTIGQAKRVWINAHENVITTELTVAS